MKPLVGKVIARVRTRRPLVHYIVNQVAMNFSANGLLALGAIPVMAIAPEEVAEITARADVLALNLGTPTALRLQACQKALAAARARGLPVVLDPVGVGASTWRLSLAQAILKAGGVTVVRGNRAEISGLLGKDGQSRGVDAIGAEEEAADLACTAAEKLGITVAVTGATDTISDGRRIALVANGHPCLTRVTGAGCLATAVIAACLAVEEDPVLAATAALAAYGVAAEEAARETVGPGSLQVTLLDNLYNLTPEKLNSLSRIAGMYNDQGLPR